MRTIAELRKMLDGREISARELTIEYLQEIERKDGAINAYTHVGREAALKAADAAQRRIDAGESAPLTGIPVAVKDNLCTVDAPTTCGSKMLENYTPPYDAAVVERLRESGAVILGKLNMDEFAMGSTTNTSYFGRVKNPYDLTRTPGGSSGGSAAAVAAGLCAASLGSDTGGSIRQPAAFCGVTGIRPTYGLVPRYGCTAFASSLDQVGPLATNARDCAVMLDAIAGSSPYDATSRLADNAPKASSRLGESVKGKRLGIIAELMGAEIDPEVRKAVENAAKYFENAGAVVEYAALPMLKNAVPAYYIISSAEASTNLSRFDGIRYGHRAAGSGQEEIVSNSRAEGFGREVKRRILLGSYALCSGFYDAYYIKAVKLAETVKAQYAQAFERFDALLSPVAPAAAFKSEELPSDPSALYVADICTVSAALAGLPALSTPCGYTESGLPLGLMITGRRWDDAGILSLADAYERDFTRKEAVL